MELVDPKTGEVFLGFAIPSKKRYPKDIQDAGFMTMFKAGWRYLMSINDLKGTDYKVLMALLTYLDFANWISVSQQTIAEELNIKQPHVATAIKKLIKYSIIERQRDPADRRRWMYRFNASLGWMGDANQWKRYMEEKANEKVIPLVRNTQD